MRERDLIEWIRRHGCGQAPPEWVGPGDDCAVVTVGEQRVLITTDQVVDGVHVRVDRSGPRAAGRKALARNLSDVAAMAAQPLCATATVSLPKTFGDADARAICEACGISLHSSTAPWSAATWLSPTARWWSP